MAKRKVSDEQFITRYMEAYQNNKDVRWLSKELGLTRAGVYQRIKRFKANGVRLPSIVGGAASADKLNDLIDKLQQG